MSEIIEISEISAPELEMFARKSERQLLNRDHPEQGLFIAESPKVITRALDAGYEPTAFLMEKRHISGEGAPILARCPSVPVYAAEFDILTGITGYELTRGMLCAMRRRPPKAASELCAGKSRIAVLESVVNPTNVGAIFRSAAALGMQAVLLTPDSCDPLYRRAIRVSMGTVFQIPWAFLGDGGVGELHGLGFKTAAMALERESLDIDDPRLKAEKRLAIVLGTEGDGLKKHTIAECDYTVCIPMSAGVDSLNVAAAGAVAFWQLGLRDTDNGK